MEGYIYLHRTLLDSNIFASEKGLKIWIWLLLKANYKQKTVGVKIGQGQSIVNLNRGQLLFGRHSAEAQTGIDGSTIYKWLKKLEKLEMIKINSNSHYTTVTICKYDEYQQNAVLEVATKEQPSSSQVTAEEQLRNTNNKDNKGNKEKNIFIIPSVEEINNYLKEQNITSFTGQYFYDYYETRGWMVGKTKMKKWKAAVRTWKNNTAQKSPEVRLFKVRAITGGEKIEKSWDEIKDKLHYWQLYHPNGANMLPEEIERLKQEMNENR